MLISSLLTAILLVSALGLAIASLFYTRRTNRTLLLLGVFVFFNTLVLIFYRKSFPTNTLNFDDSYSLLDSLVVFIETFHQRNELVLIYFVTFLAIAFCSLWRIKRYCPR